MVAVDVNLDPDSHMQDAHATLQVLPDTHIDPIQATHIQTPKIIHNGFSTNRQYNCVNLDPDSHMQDAHATLQVLPDTHIDPIQATHIQTPKIIHNGFSTNRQYNWPSLHLHFRENSKCVALYKAASKGDFQQVKLLLGEDPRRLLCASITEGYETVLHVATAAKQTSFVLELVKLMEKQDLTLQDRNGNTAFFHAASAGSVEIAKILMEKNTNLPRIRGSKGLTPLHVAVMFKQRDMASFLYDMKETKELLTEEDQTGLFFTSIKNGLYDMALKLLMDNKDLAVARDQNFRTALHVLAQKPLTSSRRSPGILKRVINSVSGMKHSEDAHMISTHALQLVKYIWVEILKQEELDVKSLIRKPSHLLFDAAKVGNSEFLAELICSYPDLVHEVDENNRSIFHVAVLHRHANTFNLIHEIDFIKDLFATFEDKHKNNILHLAAKCPHENQIGIISNAALQMQREILWFKEVEKIMQPSFREKKNSKGKTPQELFTMEHESLQRKGELWLKNTAGLCMIVATLVATITFSTAFKNVPGHRDDHQGIPIRLRETLFQVFATSNAIALWSSSISILMFLSILTSQYSENDFLKSLPLKSMVGLSTLCISVLTLMVAFSIKLFLALTR